MQKLGRAGVEVTECGLGTAPLGENWDIIEEEASRCCASPGTAVRYFDTSPWYGKGPAEHRGGCALYRRPRDEFAISSKVSRLLRRPLKPAPLRIGLRPGPSNERRGVEPPTNTASCSWPP